MQWVVYSALVALGHLHRELHIIHRDIKSANFLLTASGVVKLSTCLPALMVFYLLFC